MSLALLTAAAVHGGLFFGIPKSPSPVRPVKTESLVLSRFEQLPPVEDEILLPPDVQETNPSTGAPRPIQVDTVTIAAPDDFTMPVVATPAVDVPPLVTIPLGPFSGSGSGERIGPTTILAVDLLDAPPRTRVQTPPRYPFAARQGAQTGNVVIEFTVDESGRVINPRVIDSTNRIFDEAALQGVAGWRFEPGRREGRVVRFRMAVPVHFSLND